MASSDTMEDDPFCVGTLDEDAARLSSQFDLPSLYILKSISFVVCFRCKHAFAPTLYLPTTTNNKGQGKPPTWTIPFPPENLCECINPPYRYLTYTPIGGSIEDRVGRLTLSTHDIHNFFKFHSSDYSNMSQAYLHAYSFPFLFAWCQNNNFQLKFWQKPTGSHKLAYLTRGVTEVMKRRDQLVLKFLSWSHAKMPSLEGMRNVFCFFKIISANYLQRLIRCQESIQGGSVATISSIYEEALTRIVSNSVALFMENSCGESEERPSSTSSHHAPGHNAGRHLTTSTSGRKGSTSPHNTVSTKKRSIPPTVSKSISKNSSITKNHHSNSMNRNTSSSEKESRVLSKRLRIDDTSRSHSSASYSTQSPSASSPQPADIVNGDTNPLPTNDSSPVVDYDVILKPIATTPPLKTIEGASHLLNNLSHLTVNLINYLSEVLDSSESRYSGDSQFVPIVNSLSATRGSIANMNSAVKTVSSCFQDIAEIESSCREKLTTDFELAQRRYLTFVAAFENRPAETNSSTVKSEEMHQAISSLRQSGSNEDAAVLCPMEIKSEDEVTDNLVSLF